MKVKCPQCQKEIEYSKDNPYRPFCSERCKLIDLGEWADQKYSVPAHDISPDDLYIKEDEEE